MALSSICLANYLTLMLRSLADIVLSLTIDFQSPALISCPFSLLPSSVFLSCMTLVVESRFLYLKVFPVWFRYFDEVKWIDGRGGLLNLTLYVPVLSWSGLMSGEWLIIFWNKRFSSLPPISLIGLPIILRLPTLCAGFSFFSLSLTLMRFFEPALLRASGVWLRKLYLCRPWRRLCWKERFCETGGRRGTTVPGEIC